MHMCDALFQSHEQQEVIASTKLSMQPGRRLVLHLKYSSKCVNETYRMHMILLLDDIIIHFCLNINVFITSDSNLKISNNHYCLTNVL